MTMLVHRIRRKLELWWKLKNLNWSYRPRLEKAKLNGQEDTFRYLEEKYWYETACLLEERRRLRLRGISPASSFSYKINTQTFKKPQSPLSPSILPNSKAMSDTSVVWWIVPFSLLGGATLIWYAFEGIRLVLWGM